MNSAYFTPPHRIPAGNYFEMAVKLSQLTWGSNTQSSIPFTPQPGDRFQVSLIQHGKGYRCSNVTINGTTLTFSINGNIAIGLYSLEIIVTRADNKRLRCLQKDKIEIVFSNEEAGIPDDDEFQTHTIQLDGAILMVVNGAELQWDNTPTIGSGAAVTSDGIAQALTALEESVDEKLDQTHFDNAKTVTELSSHELIIKSSDGTEIKGSIALSVDANGIVSLVLTDKNNNRFSSMLPGLKIEGNVLKYSDSVGTWHDGFTLSALTIKGVYSTDPSGTWNLGDLILVGATNNYTLKVYDGTNWQPVGSINNLTLDAEHISFSPTSELPSTNVQDAIEKVNRNTGLNRTLINGIGYRVRTTQEDGFSVCDSDGNVVMKYDENGFDTTHLSTHISSLIKNLVKSALPSYTRVLENGFYVVDANGNIGMKYDENGLSCALVDSIPNIDNHSANEINILFIGNSFSIDNCVYLPRLLEKNSGINFTIGILYLSGRSISNHISNFNDDTPYIYYEYKSINGYWRPSGSTANTTIKDALNNGVKWNIILTHQNSDYSDKENSIIVDNTGLQTLVSLVNGYIGYKPLWGYVMTNPKFGYTHYQDVETEETFGDTMWGKMCTICQHLIEQGIVDFIVPSGTAIQNARTNVALDAYGNGEHITADGSHMEDGVGRLLGCYVLYLSLFNIVGKMTPLNDIDWYPVYGTNVNALSDSSTTNTDPTKYPATISFNTVTTADLASAKSAAEHAYLTPYIKTTIL